MGPTGWTGRVRRRARVGQASVARQRVNDNGQLNSRLYYNFSPKKIDKNCEKTKWKDWFGRDL